MHPRDLLNLARTSKSFRAFLTSRTSAPFWKAARKQVEGLPDCPPFLSEPQYANLLFFSHCHICLKPNVKTIIWEVCARFCSTGCKETVFKARREVYDAAKFALRVRKDTNVSDFAVTMVAMRRTKNSNYQIDHVYLPEVRTLEAQWQTLADEGEKIRFAQEHVAARSQRISTMEALKVWQAAELNHRSEELDNIRKARFESIVARLRQEGWADELSKMADSECMYKLKYHRAVRKPQKLTDAVWRSIRQEVIGQLESVRAARLENEWFEIYIKRLGYLRDVVSTYEASLGRRTAMTEIQACFLDLAKRPPFQQLIDASSSAEITRDDFERLRHTIPALKAAWLAEREQEFLRKAQQVIAIDGDVSLLSLAILTFECHTCGREDLKWPHVLAHSCARPVNYAYGPDSWSKAVLIFCVWTGKRPPWQAAEDLFSANVHVEVARSVVAACGFPPDVSTHAEMDCVEARLVCMACPPDPEVVCKKTFTWRGAVAHKRPSDGNLGNTLRCKGSSGESKWKLLNTALTLRVWEAELMGPTQHTVGPKLGDTRFCCAHCEFHCHDSIGQHCRSMHNIAVAQLTEDYYIHPDSWSPERSVTLFPENPERGASRAATAVQCGYGLYVP
ncbi:hypothetical protein TRAPUB_7878 [Trametes pubescens]|uniref:F-box domain-containing protein n=1 Tax=Trametes pubescens TaxID=154538 RepID=A0A1M2V268_TRAPU|nr:hypothetical protein TRAPUB_7878 [Trametes pubescens]